MNDTPIESMPILSVASRDRAMEAAQQKMCARARREFSFLAFPPFDTMRFEDIRGRYVTLEEDGLAYFQIVGVDETMDESGFKRTLTAREVFPNELPR